MGFEMNCASASDRCRSRPRRCSTWRGSAPWERCSAFSTCWCAGDEARLTFRAGTTPRLAGLTSALDDVQLAAEVRRTVPLSLRLHAARRGADRARTGAGAQGGGEVTLSGDVMRRIHDPARPSLAIGLERLHRTSATSSRPTPTWRRRRAVSSSPRSASRRSELGREGRQGQPRDRGLRRERLGGLRAAGPGGGAAASCRWTPPASPKRSGRRSPSSRARIGTIRSWRTGASVADAAVDSLYKSPDYADPAAHPVRRPAQRPTPRSEAAIKTKADGDAGADPEGRQLRPARRPAVRGSRAARPTAATCPPSPKGRFVPAFDSVGWLLQPGEVSGVVETPFGYHIIKRPTLDEARRAPVTIIWRSGRAHGSTRSTWTASPPPTRSRCWPGAPAAMRAAAEAPDESENSEQGARAHTTAAS